MAQVALKKRKKNTPLPSNLMFTTGSSLAIRMISFFIVRDAGHTLLHQSDRLKDTKWGCKAAGPRTKLISMSVHLATLGCEPLTLVLECRCISRDSSELYVVEAKEFLYHWASQAQNPLFLLWTSIAFHPTFKELNPGRLTYVIPSMWAPPIYRQTLSLPSPVLVFQCRHCLFISTLKST